MPKNQPQRRLASVSQAAKEYAVSTKTIRRYIAADRITGYRLGPKLLRVDLNEIDASLRTIGDSVA